MSTEILMTDTDAIRAALGVTAHDIPDKEIVALQLDQELDLDLLTWVSTYSALIDASNANGASAADVRKGSLLQQYAKYFCAYALSKSALFRVPQQISDGKNSMKRFSAADELLRLQENLKGAMKVYRDTLVELEGGTATSAATYFSGVGDNYDPVTG